MGQRSLYSMKIEFNCNIWVIILIENICIFFMKKKISTLKVKIDRHFALVSVSLQVWLQKGREKRSYNIQCFYYDDSPDSMYNCRSSQAWDRFCGYIKSFYMNIHTLIHRYTPSTKAFRSAFGNWIIIHVFALLLKHCTILKIKIKTTLDI